VLRARRKVLHEDAPEDKPGADKLLHLLKHQGSAAASERLPPWRMTLRGKTKRNAADRLVHFIAERRDRIRSPESRSRGRQIGSGPTKSPDNRCTKRRKDDGRRCDRPNATVAAALDTLHRNGPGLQV
jgi:hypothetical protein